MPKRTWFDILLRREDRMDPAGEDQAMLQEHLEALREVDSALASSRARIAAAINETGDAIAKERRRQVVAQLHR